MTNLVNKDTYRHKDTEVWKMLGGQTGGTRNVVAAVFLREIKGRFAIGQLPLCKLIFCVNQF